MTSFEKNLLKGIKAVAELKKNLPDTDPISAFAMYLHLNPQKMPRGAPTLNNQPLAKKKRIAAFLFLSAEHILSLMEEENISDNTLIQRVIYKYHSDEITFSRSYLQRIIKEYGDIGNEAYQYIQTYLQANPEAKNDNAVVITLKVANSILNHISKK